MRNARVDHSALVFTWGRGIGPSLLVRSLMAKTLGGSRPLTISDPSRKQKIPFDRQFKKPLRHTWFLIPVSNPDFVRGHVILVKNSKSEEKKKNLRLHGLGKFWIILKNFQKFFQLQNFFGKMLLKPICSNFFRILEKVSTILRNDAKIDIKSFVKNFLGLKNFFAKEKNKFLHLF